MNVSLMMRASPLIFLKRLSTLGFHIDDCSVNGSPAALRVALIPQPNLKRKREEKTVQSPPKRSRKADLEANATPSSAPNKKKTPVDAKSGAVESVDGSSPSKNKNRSNSRNIKSELSKLEDSAPKSERSSRRAEPSAERTTRSGRQFTDKGTNGPPPSRSRKRKSESEKEGEKKGDEEEAPEVQIKEEEEEKIAGAEEPIKDEAMMDDKDTRAADAVDHSDQVDAMQHSEPAAPTLDEAQLGGTEAVVGVEKVDESHAPVKEVDAMDIDTASAPTNIQQPSPPLAALHTEMRLPSMPLSLVSSKSPLTNDNLRDAVSDYIARRYSADAYQKSLAEDDDLKIRIRKQFKLLQNSKNGSVSSPLPQHNFDKRQATLVKRMAMQSKFVSTKALKKIVDDECALYFSPFFFTPC